MSKRPGLTAFLLFVVVVGIGFGVMSSQAEFSTLSSFEKGEKVGQTFGAAGFLLAICTYFLLKRKA